jgi:membrane-bound lytic murein transglycosylase B
VFTSLTTLAFDYPRRKEYFQSELEAYLLLARKEGWNIGETKGSYSGAMGMVQFMPSNYQKLAIDYDENGHIDLWGSEADAIGSVANYLRHHGWKTAQPWFVTAHVADQDKVVDDINRGRVPTTDMATWSSLDVLPTQPFVLQKTGLIGLRTGPDEVSFWLAYENFFTIMDYNPSRRYAMSVLELAQSIGNYESH